MRSSTSREKSREGSEQDISGPANKKRIAKSRAVVVVCVLFFVVYVSNSLWLSLFPNHMLRLGMDSLLIGVILMVYNASLSITFLPSGRLSDRLGRRPLMIAGCSLLALSTAGLSLSSQSWVMILAVVGEGIGLGLLIPSGNAMIADAVLGRRSGFVFAVYQIATLLAAVVGSFSAGALAESFGFLRMFALSAALAGGIAIFGYLELPETLERERSAYSSAVSESVRSSLSGTVKLLRSNKELALLTVALLVHAMGFSIISPFIPLFAEKGVHLDIAQVGIIMSMWNAGIAIAQIPSGQLTDRFGASTTLLAHFILSSFSWSIYAWSWNFQSAIATMLFFGVVGALDMPARRTIMIEYASAEAGKATVIGSLDAITGMMGIIGPLIGGVVWAQVGYSAPFHLASLVNAFACVPLIALVRRINRRASLDSQSTGF